MLRGSSASRVTEVKEQLETQRHRMGSCRQARTRVVWQEVHGCQNETPAPKVLEVRSCPTSNPIARKVRTVCDTRDGSGPWDNWVLTLAASINILWSHPRSLSFSLLSSSHLSIDICIFQLLTKSMMPSDEWYDRMALFPSLSCTLKCS